MVSAELNIRILLGFKVVLLACPIQAIFLVGVGRKLNFFSNGKKLASFTTKDLFETFLMDEKVMLYYNTKPINNDG